MTAEPERNKQSFYYLLFFAFLLLITPSRILAQENATEVYLSFKLRNAIDTIVIAYYKGDTFYLPYNELFELISIDHNVDLSDQGLMLFGKFLEEQTPYQIDLINFEARMGDKIIPITSEEVIIDDLDYYFVPEVYEELFDIRFEVELNNLALRLQTPHTLPVIARIIRQNKRLRANNNSVVEDQDYPVQFGQQRKLFDGGFYDYNFTNITSSQGNFFNHSSSIGLHALGGDISGNIFGTVASDFNILQSDNLRWRYSDRESPYYRTIVVGQSNTTGILPTPFNGISINNLPIEPRRSFDQYAINGKTLPDSEVELYLNNSLIDFQQSDPMGNYRFVSPLIYGISLYDVRIYGPNGQVNNFSDRVQIPFSFTPPGEVNYFLNVGRSDAQNFLTDERGFIAQGNITAGLTNKISANAGIEYFEDYHGFNNQIPTFVGSVSARVYKSNIITAELATSEFVRLNSSAILANSASYNFSYTNFFSQNSIFNRTGDEEEFSGEVFYPFNIFGVPTGVRVFGSRRIRPALPFNQLRVDLNSRLRRVQLRMSLASAGASQNFFALADRSIFITSATYNLPRKPSIPEFLRSTFIRGQVGYFVELGQMESAELVISNRITNTGQLQLVFTRNFVNEFNSLGFQLSIDLNQTRANSSSRRLSDTYTFSNSIRGSVGFDSKNKQIIFSNRQQVGRSAAAVKMYVDNDNSGTFTEGDQPITDNAIRINRTGSTDQSRKNVMYITQMEAFFKYQLQINKSAIQNPLLVPSLDNIGLITDPNVFKQIEIPFYSTGVIEGIVNRVNVNGTQFGIGGLKIFITGLNNDFAKEIRTFSDGSFYDYEMPPGKYKLEIDPEALKILNLVSSPDSIAFEIKPLAEGDFVEGILIELVPEGLYQDLGTEPVTVTAPSVGAAKIQTIGNLDGNIAIEYLEASECSYGLQIGAYLSKESAEEVARSFPDLKPKLVYNLSRELFAVRAGYYPNMGAPSKQVRDLKSAEFPDISVVNRCYEEAPRTSYYKGAQVYLLQFAAFKTRKEAFDFSKRMNDKFELGVRTVQDENDFLYKVQMGPYYDLEEVRDIKTSIHDRTKLSNEAIYLRRTGLIPQINVDFNFMLQLGEFASTEGAIDYGDQFQNEFGIKTKVLIDERQVIQLVVDRNYFDWDEVVALKNLVMQNPRFKIPVIQLLESPRDIPAEYK